MMTSQLRLPSADFQGDIHYLRGLAILLIVSHHCRGFFHWSDTSPLREALFVLSSDSTVIFMFIAGYLFEHTSRTFRFPTFLSRKFLYVVLPCSLAAIPGLVYTLVRDQDPFALHGRAIWPLWEKVLYLTLYPGMQVDYPLWFLPVICIFYVASPLLLRLMHLQLRDALVVGLLVVSVLMHRPGGPGVAGKNLMLFAYFLAPFLLGMVSCRHRDACVKLLDANFLALSAATLLVALVQLIDLHDIDAGLAVLHPGFTLPLRWVDMGLVQKILLTYWLWALVRRVPWLHCRLLGHIADTSFTIFFLHVYVLVVLYWLLIRLHAGTVEGSLIAYLALVALAVLVPCVVGLTARRLLPVKVSRMLVGS